MNAWNLDVSTLNNVMEFLKNNNALHIVELGSGEATVIFRENFPLVYSVEENIEYKEKLSPTDSETHKCLHSPLQSHTWYEENQVREFIDELDSYDCLIIDGPAYGWARDFIANDEMFSMFKYPKYIGIDDCELNYNQKLEHFITNESEKCRYKLIKEWRDRKLFRMYEIIKNEGVKE